MGLLNKRGRGTSERVKQGSEGRLGVTLFNKELSYELTD